MARLSIEGKFLTQALTGTQRYSAEMVREIDAICEEGDFELVVPESAIIRNQLCLKRIPVIRSGKHNGPIWMHFDFTRYCKRVGTVPLCFGNIAPILSKCIVTIHDVSPRANIGFYSWQFRSYQDICTRLNVKNAQVILTDTYFSKREIEHYYPAAKGKIKVVKCGWQHMNRIERDDAALDKFGLEADNYWFALSSLTPNKNLRWIAETAKLNPDDRFAVAGGCNSRTFGKRETPTTPNMDYLGYVTDGEAKALMKHCKGFIYPTFYEGFGLPPMEAMASGARLCIVGDNPCMHEVYGGSVAYIDPTVPCDNISNIAKPSVASVDNVLKQYSWRKSAEDLMCILKGIVQ